MEIKKIKELELTPSELNKLLGGAAPTCTCSCSCWCECFDLGTAGFKAGMASTGASDGRASTGRTPK
jgi:hypothetical protein